MLQPLLRPARRFVRGPAARAVHRLDRALRPVDPDLVVYGAYWSRGPACNPAAIAARARVLLPRLRQVWVVNSRHVDRVPPGTAYVIAGSRRHWEAMATAGHLVTNSAFPPGWVKRPGQRYLQTHHGTPLKHMGRDERGADLPAVLAHARQWDFSLSSNPHSTEVWERVYGPGLRSLDLGYPRNDRYFTTSEADIARIRSELGIEPGQIAVLYAPTHRPSPGRLLDPARLAARLGPRYVLLVRAHYFESPTGPAGAARDVSAHPSVEDLCLASDALVTDYSSLMFDYACLDRPIVLFAPDAEAYRTERGLYFDPLSGEPGRAPGVSATSEEELTEVLLGGTWNGPGAARLRAAFRGRFCPYDDGGAADRVVRAFFGTD
ncbi:CDP-glycerol glycerophosphotransferase family protein [Streptomyces sp. NPDC047981]|uniref:CDP-glycerol glycerophosphotransferase family protein n=1 Tax=Streptomyces sp. NPDC047981 TaxID=3154610 RepID=UPI003436B0E8